MKRPVAILGCGPSGMLVAHAVYQAGHEPIIYSPKKPSPIGGAQYLHKHIPELTGEEPDGTLVFRHVGDAEGYAKKVYGYENAPTSWNTYPSGEYQVWNLKKAYEKAWGLYQDWIVSRTLNQKDVRDLMKNYLVLSTIPRHLLCHNKEEHKFKSQNIWITRETFAPPNTIIYNGNGGPEWYRTSTIFDTPSTEWATERSGDMRTVKVRKPLGTNCDCFSRVEKFGRYGRWEKTQLTHHAYFRAKDILA